MNESEKYLGNPILFKRHKNLCFDSLISKIKKKIQSWQANVLSQAGRNILVKSIVSSLSVYNMSVLQLPKETLNSMDKMMRKLWWGVKRNFIPLNGVHVNPLRKGGLVLEKSKENNMAVLGKTAWRCITHENLLCTKIIKAKYCPINLSGKSNLT